MHAPEWVCEELERLHPYLRLGWLGEERQSPEEPLNKGKFFLLQLYHARDADLTLHAYWGKAGPIWGSRFDPLRRCPIIVMPLETEDVFSGKVLKHVKDMFRPIKERALEVAREAGREFDAEIDDLAEGMADRIMWNRHRADRDWEPLPDKFLTKEDKDIITGNVDNDRLKDFYLNQIGH